MPQHNSALFGLFLSVALPVTALGAPTNTQTGVIEAVARAALERADAVGETQQSAATSDVAVIVRQMEAVPEVTEQAEEPSATEVQRVTDITDSKAPATGEPAPEVYPATIVIRIPSPTMAAARSGAFDEAVYFTAQKLADAEGRETNALGIKKIIENHVLRVRLVDEAFDKVNRVYTGTFEVELDLKPSLEALNSTRHDVPGLHRGVRGPDWILVAPLVVRNGVSYFADKSTSWSDSWQIPFDMNGTQFVATGGDVDDRRAIARASGPAEFARFLRSKYSAPAVLLVNMDDAAVLRVGYFDGRIFRDQSMPIETRGRGHDRYVKGKDAAVKVFWSYYAERDLLDPEAAELTEEFVFRLVGKPYFRNGDATAVIQVVYDVGQNLESVRKSLRGARRIQLSAAEDHKTSAMLKINFFKVKDTEDILDQLELRGLFLGDWD